jgi:hypothetical protein
MDELSQKKTVRKIRDALDKLPTELDDTYDHTIQRIERQCSEDCELGFRILMWVCTSYRPLVFLELQQALAVHTGDKEEEADKELDMDDYIDCEALSSVCGGLVVIEESSDTVHLIRKESCSCSSKN